LPCREVTHVQHDAVCIYVDVAVESGCAAAGVAASVSGCAAAAAGVAAVVCGCAAAAGAALVGGITAVFGVGTGGRGSGRDLRITILAVGCIPIVGGSTRRENGRVCNSGTAGASRCPLNVASQQDGYF
jgi:hypothetical protein